MEGITRVYSYDSLGRQTHVITNPGATEDEQAWEYSARGLSEYGTQQGTVTYDRDAAGRALREINSNTEITSFAYSPAGDLTYLTNAMGAVTKWEYDQYGRLGTKRDPAADVELFVYTYDANGRLVDRFTPAKGSTEYFYDAIGNLTNVVYDHSPRLSFAYDANNRVTNMVDASGTTRYAYTSFGALSLEDGPWANDSVSYSYANHLRTGLNVEQPSASPLSVIYTYDSAKRLTRLSSWAGAFTYDYDPTLKLHFNRLGLPNGAYITNTFNAFGLMTATFLKNSAHAVLNSHEYAYTSPDYQKVTRQTRTDGSYVDYGYDYIGQLTSAMGKEAGGTTNRLNETLRYAYDAAGNLTRRTNNTLEQWFNVNYRNEIASINRSNKLTVIGSTSVPATNVTVNSSNAVRYADNTFASTNHSLVDGANSFIAFAQDNYGRTDSNAVSFNLPLTSSFVYDLNGNMVFDGSKAYEYDDENQLTQITATNAWKSEFTYDGKMRRRIRKEFTWQNSTWVLTNEVRYIYDGNLVIQERDAVNAPVVTYTRGKDLSGSLEGAGGIGGLLGRTDHRAGTTAFYHADRLGNVSMLVNGQQASVAQYLYDPFGKTLAANGELAEINLYRFAGKELHRNSGLTYYLYRFYDANLQRWLNRDPAGEQRDNNLHRFVRNTAVGRIDPYGLADLCPDRSTPVYVWIHQSRTTTSPTTVVAYSWIEQAGCFCRTCHRVEAWSITTVTSWDELFRLCTVTGPSGTHIDGQSTGGTINNTSTTRTSNWSTVPSCSSWVPCPNSA